MSDLARLIDDEHTGIDAVGDYLDGLDGAARWREVSTLSRARPRMLYEKAAHARPIDLAYFVGDAGVREEVIHDGVNTLPLPGPLRRFQKRFCRPEVNGHGPRLFGYNEGPTRKVVGPGFFVAVGDGSGRHVFTKTYAEHQTAVADYLRRYRQGGTPRQ